MRRKSATPERRRDDRARTPPMDDTTAKPMVDRDARDSRQSRDAAAY
jgi:hypothetical protein